MGSMQKKPCIRCLLRELAQADEAELDKYLAAIKPEDLAAEDEAERRLAVCRDCDRLSGITCNACGCYAEFRASYKDGHCPLKKW